MNFKSFKLWLNVITIAALIVLVIITRHQIAETFRRLVDLNYFWLALILPLQLVNFWSAGKFYQSYLKTLGEEVKSTTMFAAALEMNFVNHVLPSGGVSGFGYLGLRFKKLGIPASKSTLTQVVRHSLTFLSFIIYLFLAMFLLAIFGSASRIMVASSVTIIFLVLIGAGLLTYLISSASRIKKFMAFLPKAVNRLFNLFRREKKPTIDIERIEQLFEDLHGDYLQMRRNWKSLKAPFWWTMLMNLTELTTILVVYLAFGSFVNPGAIIVAYAVASTAGLIAVLPGGVGIYEGLMTAVMASAGIPKALALSATLVYRIMTMLLFIPIGFVLYQMALKRGIVEPAKPA